MSKSNLNNFFKIDLSKDLFNPTVIGTCKDHGETDFTELYIEEATYTVCVQCLNKEQLRNFNAHADAMRAAGHEVTSCEFVSTGILKSG